MRIISVDNGASSIFISKIQGANIINFMPEMYVICIYDDDWFVGYIVEISEWFLCSTFWDILSLNWFKEIVHLFNFKYGVWHIQFHGPFLDHKYINLTYMYVKL